MTTRTMVNGSTGEPQETTIIPGDHLVFQISPEVKGAPVDVADTKDDEGKQVTKITRTTLVTKQVTKDGTKTTVSEPIEKEGTMPVFVPREPDSNVS